MLNYDQKLEICKNNDRRYDGIFYIGVKSTKIYCIPSCTARFPLRKNITFFDTKENAEMNGYRGCLRCHSASQDYRPDWLIEVVDYLHNMIDVKLTMVDLENLVSKHSSTIVSEFRGYFHQTPMEYFRNLKLKVAKNRIMKGEDYRSVAFGLGYESVSGFRHSFKKVFGQTPGGM